MFPQIATWLQQMQLNLAQTPQPPGPFANSAYVSNTQDLGDQVVIQHLHALFNQSQAYMQRSEAIKNERNRQATLNNTYNTALIVQDVNRFLNRQDIYYGFTQIGFTREYDYISAIVLNPPDSYIRCALNNEPLQRLIYNCMFAIQKMIGYWSILEGSEINSYLLYVKQIDVLIDVLTYGDIGSSECSLIMILSIISVRTSILSDIIRAHLKQKYSNHVWIPSFANFTIMKDSESIFTCEPENIIICKQMAIPTYLQKHLDDLRKLGKHAQYRCIEQFLLPANGNTNASSDIPKYPWFFLLELYTIYDKASRWYAGSSSITHPMRDDIFKRFKALFENSKPAIREQTIPLHWVRRQEAIQMLLAVLLVHGRLPTAFQCGFNMDHGLLHIQKMDSPAFNEMRSACEAYYNTEDDVTVNIARLRNPCFVRFVIMKMIHNRLSALENNIHIQDRTRDILVISELAHVFQKDVENATQNATGFIVMNFMLAFFLYMDIKNQSMIWSNGVVQEFTDVIKPLMQYSNTAPNYDVITRSNLIQPADLYFVIYSMLFRAMPVQRDPNKQIALKNFVTTNSPRIARLIQDQLFGPSPRSLGA